MKRILRIIRFATLLAIALSLAEPITVEAQKLSHSELRKKRQQEEELNNESPGEKEEKPSEKRSKFKTETLMKARFEDDTKFESTAVPDPWKSESAVVIYQKQHYSYLRNNANVEVDEMVRKRIRLQDKAAVTAFSELYYIKGGSMNAIGINVIKPDGRTIPIPATGAVEVSEGVPLFYRAYYQTVEKYYKLAVPDLEPGDILDYYYFTHREIGNRVLQYAFYPLVFTLNSTYPILSQAFQFKIDFGFHIDFNSYNGAPLIKEGNAGVDPHGRRRAMIKQYELVDSSREKLSKEIWNYDLRSNPMVKFQVSYAPEYEYNINGFIGARGTEVKSRVSSTEVELFVRPRTENERGSEFATEVVKYLDRTMPGEMNPLAIAKASYYYLRYLILNYYYNTSLSESKDKERSDFFVIDDYKFTSIMRQIFWKKSLKAQIIATVPRDVGTVKDLLLPGELSLFFTFKNGDSNVYVYPFHNYSSFDSHDELLEGTEAYAVMPVGYSPDIELVEEVKVPASTYLQNVNASDLEVTLAEGMESMDLVRKTSLTGLFKSAHATSLYLSNVEYLQEDRKKYDPQYTDTAWGKMKSNSYQKQSAEENRKKESLKEDKAKEQADLLRKDLEGDYEVVSYDQFEVLNSGRYDEDPALRILETFKIKSLVSQAGKNYIFEIGKLIGKQIELKGEDLNRKNDVYLPFARMLSDDIIINLPAGYTADGLNDLQFYIDNASGSFQSSARQEGNKLVVSTKKIYKTNFEKKEDWNKLTEVLETAYKFTQKKVILKKK